MRSDELSELKAEFLSSLNYEIRTPLSGLLGMLDLLLETRLSDEQKEYADSARICGETLLEIMNSTLEFSALCANQVKFEEGEFPLHEMLTGLAREYAPKAESKGLTIIENFTEPLPEVVIGDALRLKQLLMNILDNAIKFTNHGFVELTASATELGGDEILLRIAIRDTGIGIPSDKIACIFDSFRQIEGGLSRRYGGMGLGLAVSRKLAQLMRADISVESEDGKGSTFVVTIPLRVPHEMKSWSNTWPEGSLHILVVDDSELARTVVSHILHRSPHQVDCAKSGAEAFELAAVRQYDLVLMDLQMPGMDGLEAADLIRTIPGYSDVPIVALTANSSTEFQRLCEQHGMQGLLAKPVQSNDLLLMVKRYLRPRMASL